MTDLFGENGRIGVIVPANNTVLEPELGTYLPPGVALYATRILAKGDLTPEAVVSMEHEVGRAVDELAATGVDVLVYADMVTTFIMEEGWNEAQTSAIATECSIPCISAWTALRDALSALAIRRFALATPYPTAIHDLARPFFENKNFTVTDDSTLDIMAMAEVPRVPPERLDGLVQSLDCTKPEAIVLLATDLPTLASIEALETAVGLAVLSSNSCLLWSALRTIGVDSVVPALGQLAKV